ncbi:MULTISPECIES: Hpt domain-containing protein, partial [unclassified Bradyrhizobium]
MDDLLREFLTETSESLDTVDNQLVKFEQEPNNAKILDNIFRLVHTIKGTCGFLGLPRLEALAHAGETLMGKFRDGMPVTAEAVTVILSSIDRIKEILAGLEATEAEPEGNDRDLIDKLEAMVEQGMAAMSGSAQPMPSASASPIAAAGSAAAPVADAPPLAPEAPAAAPAKEMATGTLIDQTLERPLRPGEVSLDELERAFRETAIEAPVPAPVAKAEVKPEVKAEPAPEAPAAKDAKPAREKAAPKKSMADEGAGEGASIANQ